jgi:hypothetical protein
LIHTPLLARGCSCCHMAPIYNVESAPLNTPEDTTMGQVAKAKSLAAK